MRRNVFAAVLAALALSGCYRLTVVTGAPEASQVVEKPWQMSYVYGLIPPPELSVAQPCTGGVAKAITEHSFLNGLVAFITWQIVTPITVKVTCASGPVAR
jgi:hypothetical protein